MFKIEVCTYDNGFIGYVMDGDKTLRLTSPDIAKELAEKMQREARHAAFYKAVDATYGMAA